MNSLLTLYRIYRLLAIGNHSFADFFKLNSGMDGVFFWEMVALEVGRQKTSFEWLYRKTKVSKGTFSSWKTRNLLPRADIAYKIAESLGVTVEYLLTGREQSKEVSNLPVHHFMEEIAKDLVFFDSIDLETLRIMVSSMSQRYRAR